MDTANQDSSDIEDDVESGNVSTYVPNPKRDSPRHVAIKQHLATYPLPIRRFATEELIHLDGVVINRAIANLSAEMPNLLELFKKSIGRSKVKAETYETVYKDLDEAFVRKALDYVIELRSLYR